jgi:hypothetical protein
MALLIFGTTFAAFCVWLTVLSINRREPWAVLVAILLVGACAWWRVFCFMQPAEVIDRGPDCELMSYE